MKIIISFLFVIFLINTTTAQLGTMRTADGEEMALYKNPKKNKRTGRMQKNCDCQLGKGNLFLYFNEAGKLSKHSQGKITKVNLNQGATLCREYDNEMADLMGDLGIKIPQNHEMLGLPFKKSGGPKVLQDIIYRSDDYLLTMYTSHDLNNTIYIFKADDLSYVTGRYKYMEVGYGKSGKKALTDIKTYFKNCPAMIKTIESTIEKNKGQKGFRRSFALDGIKGGSCE